MAKTIRTSDQATRLRGFSALCHVVTTFDNVRLWRNFRAKECEIARTPCPLQNTRRASAPLDLRIYNRTGGQLLAATSAHVGNYSPHPPVDISTPQDQTFASLKAVLFDTPPERGVGDPQPLCRLAPIPTSLFEGTHNARAFVLGARGRGELALGNRHGQMFERNFVGPTDHGRALDNVAQFANIAGEVIPPQRFCGLRRKPGWRRPSLLCVER